MEGLHNTIKDALSGFANDTRVELENLQKQINFEVHNSMDIFTITAPPNLNSEGKK